MSFKDVPNIKQEYQTLNDEVVANFYIPCLKHATHYKRAVGYFSSSILLEISKGLASIALRGGKIDLLIAPTLSKEDYEAIKKGYAIKAYTENKIIDSFDEFIEYEQKEDRFGLLSYLIKEGILDIKVVVLEEENDRAIFHDKLGIMYDDDGNIVAFSGSANETYNGYKSNYENIDVFCSWVSEDTESRCISKEIRFDKLWKGKEKGCIVFDFPEVIKDKLLKYSIGKEELIKLDEEVIAKYKKSISMKGFPSTKNINLYDYQQDAINSWKKSNYKGIFDMATGTGKTFTGCGAISKLYEDKKRVFVWICCPFTHLVDQWAEEVKIFNIEPIVCYGSEKKYKDKLKRYVMKFKHKRADFICVIITNTSFKKDFIQSMVKENLSDSLLLVDEAHNFGAYHLSECMNLNYPYRLALSATLERYGDEKGTQRLLDFFGEKCITYTLERAIQEQKLTPYKYYPILVSLNVKESESYEYLTNKIRKIMTHFNEDVDDIPEEVKKLLIKRARLVAGAENKVNALKNVLMNYKDENNLLVYCGAVKYGQYGYNECSDEKKQIQIVSEMMTQDLKMKVSRFTAEESTEERRAIIEMYKNEDIQALVAIKCLDEGMNVPTIKTAFILASSTNPKEYIQRRGRVLRKSKGKIFAKIYDFVTLPRSLEAARTGMIDKDNDLGLVRRELARVIDFANLSSNPSYSNEIINSIYDAFDIDVIQGEVNIYE